MEKKNKEDMKKSLLWALILVLVFAAFVLGKFLHNKGCGEGLIKSDAENNLLKADKFMLNQKVKELNVEIAEAGQKVREADEALKAKNKEVGTALRELVTNKNKMGALEERNKRLRLETDQKQAETKLLEVKQKNKEAQKAEIEAVMKERDERIKGKRYDARGKMVVIRQETKNCTMRVFVDGADKPFKVLAWKEAVSKSYEGFDAIKIRLEIVRAFGEVEQVDVVSFEPKEDPKTGGFNGVWIYRLIEGVMVRTQDRNALPLQF